MNKTEIAKLAGEQLIKFSSKFTDKGFWSKVMKFARKAGLKITYYAVTLYYTMLDEDTPYASKLVIMGALGYFILPVDLIPDIAPGIGFTDDLAALTSAFVTVAMHIKPEHKEKALIQIQKIFKEAITESEVAF
ncbi:YkvA family protein [Flammeovirga sp. SubArs3]|uniref:YkvA family protein n=1 Tax=Flammeovirga sp. SubArs3 TaxID=2995316 RepID=UPI00248B9DC6|nr:YkvA family protein [Flammeovirga sp. SubArs3]